MTAPAHIERVIWAPWHELPAARRLLARIVASPPRAIHHRDVYVQTADEWTTYESPDVDALRRVYEADRDARMSLVDRGITVEGGPVDSVDTIVGNALWAIPPEQTGACARFLASGMQ